MILRRRSDETSLAAGTDALRVDHITVRYGDAAALVDVSLQVQAGSVLAVLGANGAGKSTLAQTIAGFKQPDHGSIRIDGVDVTKQAAHHRFRNGVIYLPETRGIFPSMSVADNLLMATRLQGSASRRAALERVYEIFPVLGGRRGQVARTLSGGEQQMLAMARVVANDARLLIADEPSLGLAPRLVDAVYSAIRRFREAGITMVMIEQYIGRALDVADQVLILKLGTCHWVGPAEDATPHIAEAYGLAEHAQT